MCNRTSSHVPRNINYHEPIDRLVITGRAVCLYFCSLFHGSLLISFAMLHAWLTEHSLVHWHQPYIMYSLVSCAQVHRLWWVMRLLDMCMNVYMYVYVYVCICMYVCVFVCMCIIYIYIYICMYICKYVCKYVCLSVCLSVCMYVYTCFKKLSFAGLRTK